jgi:hypothetical protein
LIQQASGFFLKAGRGLADGFTRVIVVCRQAAIVRSTGSAFAGLCRADLRWLLP